MRFTWCIHKYITETLYEYSYLAICRWLGLRNCSVYLYVGTVKSLTSIPHISWANSYQTALHVVTWLYIASNLNKVGSVYISQNDRINCDGVHRRGLDMCNYKFLEIWFWCIQFNISREWRQLFSHISPLLSSYSRYIVVSTVHWKANWIVCYFSLCHDLINATSASTGAEGSHKVAGSSSFKNLTLPNGLLKSPCALTTTNWY